jgi:hypothetical protein
MDRRSIKKLILILLIYNLYLKVKSEDSEFIFKIFNERYNNIQYNKDYRE